LRRRGRRVRQRSDSSWSGRRSSSQGCGSPRRSTVFVTLLSSSRRQGRCRDDVGAARVLPAHGGPAAQRPPEWDSPQMTQISVISDKSAIVGRCRTTRS
jgi:hypothetical protein